MLAEILETREMNFTALPIPDMTPEVGWVRCKKVTLTWTKLYNCLFRSNARMISTPHNVRKVPFRDHESNFHARYSAREVRYQPGSRLINLK